MYHQKSIAVSDEALAYYLNAMSCEFKKQMDKIAEETDQLNVILKSIPAAFAILNTQRIIQQSNTVFGILFNTASARSRPLHERVL
jgi:hypothetical protein